MKNLLKVLAVFVAITLAILIFTAYHNKNKIESTTESTAETLSQEITTQEEITKTITDDSFTLKYDEISLGDYITFGKYEQNNVTEDGKEDISWLVLAKEDSKILLISKYALDCKDYHETEKDVTWETCDLRKWLNKDFFEEAFTQDEQKRIAETSLVNEDNPEYGTKGGNPTVDKVFALSVQECYKFFPENAHYKNALYTHPTDYAVVKGAYRGNGSGETGSEEEDLGLWWLRTPGIMPTMAMCVIVGAVKTDGAPVDNYWKDSEEFEDGVFFWGGSVRPAMWITVE